MDDLERVFWTLDDKPVDVEGDFSFNTVASGGFDQFRGSIPERQARKVAALGQGSQVTGWLGNGVCVYQGRLAAPPHYTGGRARLAAQGPKVEAEKYATRRLFQSRDYTAWVTSEADPHNYDDEAPFSFDPKAAALVLAYEKAAILGGNEKNGPLFWADGCVITRVAFSHGRTRSTAQIEMRIYRAADEGASRTLDTTYNITSDITDGGTKDLTLGGTPELVNITLAAIGGSGITLKSSGAQTTSTNGSTIDLLPASNDRGDMPIALDVLLDLTNASGSPRTLNVDIQTSGDGTNWRTIGELDEVAAAAGTTATRKVNVEGVGRYVRYKSTITGSSPSFTYSISADPGYRGLRVRLTNLRVNGLTTSDTFYGYQVVDNTADLLGWDPTGIETSTLNVLPLDWQGPLASMLGYVAMLEDRRWLVLEDRGSGSYCDYQDWGTREWVGYQASGIDASGLVPQELFNKVTVSYTAPGGVDQERSATATVASLDAHGITNTAFFDLSDPQPGGSLATSVATAQVNRLSQQRYAGPINVTKATLNGRNSPREIMPGDKFRVPDWATGEAITLRVHEVQQRKDGVTLGIEQPVSPARRLAKAALVRARRRVKARW